MPLDAKSQVWRGAIVVFTNFMYSLRFCRLHSRCFMVLAIFHDSSLSHLLQGWLINRNKRLKNRKSTQLVRTRNNKCEKLCKPSMGDVYVAVYSARAAHKIYDIYLHKQRKNIPKLYSNLHGTTRALHRKSRIANIAELFVSLFTTSASSNRALALLESHRCYASSL